MKLFVDNNIIFYSKENSFDSYPEDCDIYKMEIEIDSVKEKEKMLKINVNSSILERDNKLYLEITASKASVFQAIDQISLKSNISLKDILVICGNNSEIALVNNIVNNYVVKNAPKELLDIAKKKTESNDNNGVERVLKTL